MWQSLITVVVAIILGGMSAKAITPSVIQAVQVGKGQNEGTKCDAIYNATLSYMAQNAGNPPANVVALISGNFLPLSVNNNGDSGTFTVAVNSVLGTIAVSTQFVTQTILNAHLYNYKNAIAPCCTNSNVVPSTCTTTYQIPTQNQAFLQAYTGNTAPSSATYSKWYDTSGTSVVLKMWDSGSSTWKAFMSNAAITTDSTLYASVSALQAAGAPAGGNGTIANAYDSNSSSVFQYTFYSGTWYQSGGGLASTGSVSGGGGGSSCTCTSAGQVGCNNCTSNTTATLSTGGSVYYESVDPSNTLGFASADKMWFYHNSSSSATDVNNAVLKYNANAQGAYRGTSGTAGTLLYYMSGGGLAGNGLYYTGQNGTLATYACLGSNTNTTTEAINGLGASGTAWNFGVTTWSSATCNYVNDNMNSNNICAVLGMRLPKVNETRETDGTSNGWSSYNPCGSDGSASGVPYNTGWTWTATSFSGYTGTYWGWNGAGSGYGNYGGGNYVRCVR